MGDLTRYVLDRVDMFSRRLTVRLLVHEAGRPFGCRDRRAVDEIVALTRVEGNGLRDMIIVVVQSEPFAPR